MKAIKTQNSMKQLIFSLSMLLFLFAAGNIYSQQAGVRPAENSAAASLNSMAASQLGYEILQSSPVKYDRTTELSYSIPKEMDVEVKIYDKQGFEIKTLVNETKDAGTYKISFAEFKDGIYFYQLNIGPYSEIKKIQLSY